MDCQQERNTLPLLYKHEMNPNTNEYVNCQVNNHLCHLYHLGEATSVENR